MSYPYEPELYCSECKEPCDAVEETWDYPGTHCTHGQAGIHHSGNYVSNCCLAELIDGSDLIDEAEYRLEEER